MKLKRILLMTLCASLLMGSCLTACRPAPGTTDDTTEGSVTPQDSESATWGDTTEGTDADTEPDTEGEVTPTPEPVIAGPYADTLMLSNRLADGVQAYYGNPARSVYRIENQTMKLDYSLADTDKLIASLQNSKGQAYLTNTMDVFISMADGKTYLASQSTASD